MVLGFACEGVRVVVAARNPDEVARVQKEALDAGAPAALGIPVDVTQEAEVERLSWQIDREFGQLDVLVNHVGGGMHFFAQYDPASLSWAKTSTGPAFWDFPFAWWEQVIKFNLNPTFLCSKFMTRRFFARQRRGSIINSSSGHSVMVMPFDGMTAYGTAKAAVNHFTRVMARELKPLNVAANAILCPLIKAGAVETNVFGAMREQTGGWYRPEIMVPLVLHLAEQDAQGITGQVVPCLQWIEEHGHGPLDKWRVP
jgi:3-oxoacyl-[acyl-carrier protein] reductase